MSDSRTDRTDGELRLRLAVEVMDERRRSVIDKQNWLVVFQFVELIHYYYFKENTG